jgi:hypothetical protein
VGVCECGGQKMKECKALVHVCEDVRSTSGVCVCMSVCIYIYAQPLVCVCRCTCVKTFAQPLVCVSD